MDLMRTKEEELFVRQTRKQWNAFWSMERPKRWTKPQDSRCSRVEGAGGLALQEETDVEFGRKCAAMFSDPPPSLSLTPTTAPY